MSCFRWFDTQRMWILSQHILLLFLWRHAILSSSLVNWKVFWCVLVILMGVGICMTRLSTSRTSYLFHSSLCLNRNESKFKVLSNLFVSTHQLLFLLLVSCQGHVDDEWTMINCRKIRTVTTTQIKVKYLNLNRCSNSGKLENSVKKIIFGALQLTQWFSCFTLG
jgi:hypothetical protein